MIKECRVIVNNKDAIVVNYDSILIQFPPSKLIYDRLTYVKCTDGKYELISHEEYMNSLVKKKKIKKEISKEEVDETIDM